MTGDAEDLRQLQPDEQLLKALFVDEGAAVDRVDPGQPANIGVHPKALRAQLLESHTTTQEQANARRITPAVFPHEAKAGEGIRQGGPHVQRVEDGLGFGRAGKRVEEHVGQQRRPDALQRHAHRGPGDEVPNRAWPCRREAARDTGNRDRRLDQEHQALLVAPRARLHVRGDLLEQIGGRNLRHAPVQLIGALEEAGKGGVQWGFGDGVFVPW